MLIYGIITHVLTQSITKSHPETLFTRHPVLTLETWAAALGGPPAAARARDRARYYCRTGRLRRLAHGLYAVVSPGADPAAFSPDPYLVAAALRDDTVLSHHTALDLLGVARSVFNRFAYFTARVRRPLRVDSVEWHALAHPRPLERAGQARFGVTRIDRHGVILEVTGPERTLVDGFSSLRWGGGLEEHVESSAGFRDLDLDLLQAYLGLLGRASLYGAVGWFLDSHPETGNPTERVLSTLANQAPRQARYLGPRRRGATLLPRWNVLVPSYLATTRLAERTVA